ncbi:MAG: hypothetical protein ABIG28_01505 [archaeon]
MNCKEVQPTMRSNTSFDAGSLILINKIDKEFNFFDNLFDKLTGKTKHLKESAKAFINGSRLKFWN